MNVGAVATAPGRTLTGTYWHQGAAGRPVTSCADPALGPGRYHRQGEPGVWYASNQEQGAWAEFFRHFTNEGIDPFEVRRRVGRVSVDLRVLDLTDKKMQARLGVDEDDLVSDNCALTQEIAYAAREAGFDAVLAPAAALPGCQTLAVFCHALPKVTADRSEVRQPPPRIADLLPMIRPHEDVPDAVLRLLKTLESAGAEAIRRLRR
ncbi:RES family NAD+ phosphorylase [Mycobacterium barrassiae]|uniref:RES family NAD+ phosphorylase n=1 Tax=Mycobacterium barrassiae TaxID=319709 RepID=UPI002265811A|nr:RES family NAD+ phosphorylase [Mycobacterium barrassiae]MCV7302104.1 RES family NAD+ phosphorylase [Mycobacterium barrassiae]